MIAEQLKKSILQEALQGKLTEQLPEDGDSNELLKEIRKDKAEIETLLSEITEDEYPFDIPENWKWCYLESISMKIHYGYTASAETAGNSKMLRITDIQDNTVNWDTVPYCHISDSIIESYKLQNRDIVIARTGGTIGKTFIVRNLSEKAVFASYLIRVIPSKRVSEEYLKYFMESDLYWKQLIDKSQGTGQPNVNGKSLSRLMLPLPPINEQKRIVDRIDELFPSIDELKYDENKLVNLQKSFPEKLKDSIFKYAMQGKLTKQLSEDGDANDVKKNIERDQIRLIKEGKIKKGNLLLEITENEMPYDIPENWCWMKLGDVITVSSGKGLTQNNMDIKGAYPVYGANGINGYHNEYFIQKDTLVIGRVGFYCGCVHRTISNCWVTDNALVVNFKDNIYTLDFLMLIIEFLNLKSTSVATAQPVISGKRIYPSLIPVPPLEEQKRIVKRIEECLNEIEDLTEQLSEIEIKEIR